MLRIGKNKNIDVLNMFEEFKLSDLFSFRRFIAENFTQFKDDEQDAIYKACKRILKGLFLHLSFAFLCLFILVVLIVNIFLGFITFIEASRYDQSLRVLSILFAFIFFYFTPFMRLIGKNGVANILERLIQRSFTLMEKLVQKAAEVILSIIGFAFAVIYVYFVNRIWESLLSQYVSPLNIERIDVIYYVGAFLLYQYCLSVGLARMFGWLEKILFKDEILSKSIRAKHQKNNIYLHMIIIYMGAIILKIESWSLFIAMTVTFLLDTYFQNYKNIKKESK